MNCVIYDAFLYGLISGTVHLNNIDEFCLALMDTTYHAADDKTTLSLTWSENLDGKRARAGVNLVEVKDINLIADIKDTEAGHQFLVESDDNITWENLTCNIGSLVLYNKTANIPIACYEFDSPVAIREMDFVLKSPMNLLEFTI